MDEYIIMKASRTPGGGTATPDDAYDGFICGEVGIVPGQVYDDYEEARHDVKLLNGYNSVRFVVWLVGGNQPIKETF